MVKKLIPWLFTLLSLTMLMSWIVLPDHTVLNLSITIMSCVLAGIWCMLYRLQVKAFFKSSFFQVLTSKMIYLCLLFLIFSSLSYILHKKPMVWDFTKQKVNTVSDKTKKVLDLFKSQVEVEIYGSSDEIHRYHSMLNLYRNYRSDLKIKLIDMQLQPALVKMNLIQKSGEAILKYQNKTIKAYAATEIALTSGLIKLAREDQFHIAFSVGHGELSIEKQSEQSIQFLRNELVAQNYIVSTVDLHTEPIAAKVDLLIIAGPTQKFLSSELIKFENYIKNGGNLAFFLDPSLGELDPLKDLRNWLAQHKLIIANDIVVDKLSTMEGTDPSVLVIKKFPQNSSIVNSLQGRVIMPLTSSVRVNGVTFESLLTSNLFPACWAEQNLQQLKSGQVIFDQEDVKGPIDLVLIASLESSSKILLAGSSRWIMDGYANNPTNINLVLNAISSMIGDAGLISLNRPGFLQERIFISEIQTHLILYTTVILGPLLLLIVAFVLYRLRVRWSI
jgi:hypothetical protein